MKNKNSYKYNKEVIKNPSKVRKEKRKLATFGSFNVNGY